MKSRRVFCSKCNGPVVNNICQICGTGSRVEKFHDPDWDAYFDDVMKENKEYFDNIVWEEAPDEVL